MATKKPQQVFDFSEHAGEGLSNLDASDIEIPRLRILQKMSQELDEDDANYHKDFKAGQIYHTTLKETYDSIVIIPFHHYKSYIEWDTERNGIIAVYTKDEIARMQLPKDKGNWINGDNIINETANLGCFLVLAENNLAPSLISMSSTQLKKMRSLMTLALTERITNKDGIEVVPPLFYRAYTLGTIKETRDQHSWYGWTVKRDKLTSEIVPANQMNKLVSDIKATTSHLKLTSQSQQAIEHKSEDPDVL